MKPAFAALALMAATTGHASAQAVTVQGDLSNLTISGISSGAAMAVQYAVAHSASVAGVASIAGPPWGCAHGSAAQAVNDCMCGGNPVAAQVDRARDLAADGKIAPLDQDGRPQGLKRAYVFQSPADNTVVEASGQTSARFLEEFIHRPVMPDKGNHADGSDRAGHGIISPRERGFAKDSCTATGFEHSYIRTCGAEDNPGKALAQLQEEDYDRSRRVERPQGHLLGFDQQAYVERVAADTPVAADPDLASILIPVADTSPSERRRNLDMDRRGFVYVPPQCDGNATCRIHIALHGCKQDGETFARHAGYNNWADRYGLIVVYPTIRQADTTAGEACLFRLPESKALDKMNPNGCWDWWGYLDPEDAAGRYVTKDAPQMRVIDAILTDLANGTLMAN
ncbi:MAG TPA: PHB depolymerase family esterase [Magnetospirillum sp.]|jgi:poly(3-hydroxybutyrate) depolymerase|nr:PHB depolymerase family esterase [Magnetospirillum sp.]